MTIERPMFPPPLVPDAPRASRRGLLRGMMAAAAVPVTSAVVIPFAPALAKATEADPALAAIASHRDAMDQWTAAIDRKKKAAAGTPERKAAEEEVEALADLEDDALWEVLTVYPTTLPGVIKLLDHVGQDRFLCWYDYDEEGDFDTLLMSWSKDRAGAERRLVARDFTMHLAHAIREIIERGQA